MHEIDRIIGKQIAGEATESELKALSAWLAESEENQVVYSQIRSFWEDSHENTVRLEQKSWAKLSAQIDGAFQESNYPINSTKNKLYKGSWLWAAIVTLLLVSGMFFFIGNQTENIDVAEVEILTRKALYGQKLLIGLSDGTKIKLNSGSTLRYPKQFTGNKRQVELIGEAFFEVARNPEKPFIISTGNVETTVLGTSFNVLAPVSGHEVQVAVVTGKVKVSDTLSKNEMLLLPEDMATVTVSDGKIDKSYFDPNEVLAWKEGKLVFKDDNILQIFTKLEVWYGYSFVWEKGLKLAPQNDYYAVFQDQSLKNVLENLSHSYGFNFELNHRDKTVLLMK